MPRYIYYSEGPAESGWSLTESRQFDVVQQLHRHCAAVTGRTCDERGLAAPDWCNRCQLARKISSKRMIKVWLDAGAATPPSDKTLSVLGDIFLTGDVIDRGFEVAQPLVTETILARANEVMRAHRRWFDEENGQGAYDRVQKDTIHQMVVSINPHN